jgi:hypothetical protein
MAEEKDTSRGMGKEGIHWVEVIFGVLMLLFFLNWLGSFLSRHLGVGSNTGNSGFGYFPTLGQNLAIFFINIFPSIQFVSIFLTLLFLMGIIYASFRLSYLRKMTALERRKKSASQEATENQIPENPKWQKVLEHVNSTNPSDWRLAILEADILLGDMLEKMGYRGEGIGEMLKSVEESDFNTINNAWEAHKIRNAIAHEGADFTLTQKEAGRVIDLYRSVFEEFHFV